jgi:hypothetical protein
MSLLEIGARGLAFEIFEINEELATTIFNSLITEDEFNDLFEYGELEPIFQETGITSSEYFKLDGEEININLDNIKTENLTNKPIKIGRHGHYYVLVTEIEKGIWVNREFDGEFELKLLNMQTQEYALPDGSQISHRHYFYDGEGEIGDTWGMGFDRYLIMADGNRHDINFTDES